MRSAAARRSGFRAIASEIAWSTVKGPEGNDSTVGRRGLSLAGESSIQTGNGDASLEEQPAPSRTVAAVIQERIFMANTEPNVPQKFPTPKRQNGLSCQEKSKGCARPTPGERPSSTRGEKEIPRHVLEFPPPSRIPLSRFQGWLGRSRLAVFESEFLQKPDHRTPIGKGRLEKVEPDKSREMKPVRAVKVGQDYACQDEHP